MMYIDAHCHFDKSAPAPKLTPVGRFICNAVLESDWPELQTLPSDLYSVAYGVHPWHAAAAAPGWDARLCDILTQNPGAMVGEIGLDKLRPDFDIQCAAFRRALEIAHDMARTAHIHCVRAWDVMLAEIARTPPPVIVMHGFYASPEIVSSLLRRGNVYFSYGPAVLRHATPRMAACIRATPDDRFLAESDATPAESASLMPSVVRTIAQIKSIDNKTMSDIIYSNSLQVISNGQITQN